MEFRKTTIYTPPTTDRTLPMCNERNDETQRNTQSSTENPKIDSVNDNNVDMALPSSLNVCNGAHVYARSVCLAGSRQATTSIQFNFDNYLRVSGSNRLIISKNRTHRMWTDTVKYIFFDVILDGNGDDGGMVSIHKTDHDNQNEKAHANPIKLWLDCLDQITVCINLMVTAEYYSDSIDEKLRNKWFCIK